MPSETSILTKLAVSPSGDALALADNEGLLNLWGRRPADTISFAEYSKPIEWPDTPQDQLPSIDINDPEIPLSEVGMPYYSSELLSTWPAHLVYDVGLPAPRIDEKTFKGMTRQDWYLYGRWNSNGRRRYQVDKVDRVEEAPRFRSQVEKERVLAGAEDGEEMEKVVGRFEGGEGGVPNYYKQVEIKYSKFGVEDFDFGYLTLEMELIIDSTIRRRSLDWRRILRTRMPMFYFRFIILRHRYDYMPLHTQLRPVAFPSVLSANLASYSRT